MRLRTWRQAIRGSRAEKARGIVDAIARRLSESRQHGMRSIPLERGASYGYGVSGEMLLLVELARAGQESVLAEQLESMLELAVSSIEDPQDSVSFFHSFPGVAWTLLQASDILFEVSDSFARPVDQVLLDVLAQDEPMHEFDLMNGIAGLAAYWQGRAPNDDVFRALKAASRQLALRSAQGDVGVYWEKNWEEMPEEVRGGLPAGQVNLGVAHGTPGVMGALSYVVEMTGDKEARLLLAKATDWLIAQRRSFNGSLGFPDKVWPGGSRTEPSRIAWCYGDASIAAVLHRVSVALDNSDYRATALDIARAAAARPFESFGVQDPSVCHGSAGVAHIFNRLFQATGSHECLSVANHWFDVLIDEFDEADPDGGYRFQKVEPGTRNASLVVDYGLLSGLSGVALALLSGYAPHPPVWDEPLMLGCGYGAAGSTEEAPR